MDVTKQKNYHMHNNEYLPNQYGVGSTSDTDSPDCNMSTLERVLSATAGAILVYTSLKRIGKNPLNKLYKASKPVLVIIFIFQEACLRLDLFLSVTEKTFKLFFRSLWQIQTAGFYII